MKDLVFVFGVHNHQPVGNFLHVFEKAFKECYIPFLAALRNHPSIKFTIHFSGPLWEYMQSKEIECWDMVKELVSRGQAELMGGGFYEPVLAVIPEEDRIGQITMMNSFIEENFGIRPRGLWLTERIWEPHLPKTLSLAGLEYIFLDEEHFHYAGIKNLHTTYMTEDEGRPLRLFPVDKKLRYLIPFAALDKVRGYLHEIRDRGGAAILGDDGEKFGLWPGTHQWVFKEGWLENFLCFLEEENIKTVTCSEFIDGYPPGGNAYLPPASYEEMMKWILEPEDQERLKKLRESAPPESRRFIRGGFFREFFLKYPESNHLHKRMLHVSREVRNHGDRNARRELYKAQCNDPYWHGVFGGLYLPHLREAAYRHLLEAEKMLALKAGWEIVDYDLDGREEVFFRGEKFQILLKPSFGGGIVELDYLPLSRNLTDVLSRRKEAYHAVKEEEMPEGMSIHELARALPPGTEELLRYDWHPRFSLLDHFLHPRTKKEDFVRVDYGEVGDFVNREYRFILQENGISLEREGHIWSGEKRCPLLVRKILIPERDGFQVAYRIENTGREELSLTFGSEWNFYLLPHEVESTGTKVDFLDGKLSLEAPDTQDIWTFPLRTLSQSEKGYDIIYQGLSLLPLWKFRLGGGESISLKIKLRENDER